MNALSAALFLLLCLTLAALQMRAAWRAYLETRGDE